MRLINVQDLKFEEFFEGQIPPYAILSHTWAEEELSFDEWQRRKDVKKKKGYSKIMKACEFAGNLHEVRYIWIDTVCIDKRSSAELMEAINSMYNWYHNSKICIVYLADVDSRHPEPSDHPDYPSSSRSHESCKPLILAKDIEEQFLNSRWFKRGWTLQELLAPQARLYLSKDWKIIGTHERLIGLLSKASGVAEAHLRDSNWREVADVSLKMSWASERKTTRVEDMAYCLMGIFNINMSLIYGEGDGAFRRLQLKIIKKSDDNSIFAWDRKSCSKVFAPSPEYFSRQPSPMRNQAGHRRRSPYEMTNSGLRITLKVFQTAHARILVGVLGYKLPGTGGLSDGRFCLVLQRKDEEDWYMVIGSMVVETLGNSGFDVARLMEKTLYLTDGGVQGQAAPHSLSLHEQDRRKQFFLLHAWNSRPCAASLMRPRGGIWWATTSDGSGMVPLRNTSHSSGMQIQVLRLVKTEGNVREEAWFAVLCDGDSNWSAYTLPHHKELVASDEDIITRILSGNYDELQVRKLSAHTGWASQGRYIGVQLQSGQPHFASPDYAIVVCMIGPPKP